MDRSPLSFFSIPKLSPTLSSLLTITGITTVILFICSAVRHALFNSNGWDVGIFDQAIYLISIGKPPFSTFLDFHILGDHAAFIFYPLALLYKIYPDIHWLFAVQSLVLASGALPTWLLCRQAGLEEKQSRIMAIAYLLYPLVFNINLFDFHADIFVLPGILWAVFLARSNQIWWFCGVIAIILSCKGALALTVASLGFWLLVFEKKRLAGSIALVVGIIWFLVAIKIIIPYFGTEAADLDRHLNRYSHLGQGFAEIAQNLVTNPGLLLGSTFNLANFGYLFLIFAPLGWGISSAYLTPMVGAIPALAMNLLTTYQAQKDLIHQYSLPILPFIILSVISAWAADRLWLKKEKLILIWSIIAFAALAKYGYFWSIYLRNLNTLAETKTAITLVSPASKVLTNSEISPHLTHREIIRMGDSPNIDFTAYDQILLNIRYSSYSSPDGAARKLVQKIRATPGYKLVYRQNRVFLFNKESLKP